MRPFRLARGVVERLDDCWAIGIMRCDVCASGAVVLFFAGLLSLWRFFIHPGKI